MDAVEPNWAMLRPFVLDSASQFSARGALRLRHRVAASPFMPRGARGLRRARRPDAPSSATIAAFWDCNPYVDARAAGTRCSRRRRSPRAGTGWASSASRLAAPHADATRSAEAYARTAVALADGFISSWDAKFRTGVVRPETVINTYLDEAWEPLLQTPPFPEYTSGHSVISTAASVVLTQLFGERFAFTDTTEREFGLPVRSFASFEQAAAEAAISRLYGGIHYRHSIEQGALQGRKVGQLVVARVVTRATGRGRGGGPADGGTPGARTLIRAAHLRRPPSRVAIARRARTRRGSRLRVVATVAFLTVPPPGSPSPVLPSGPRSPSSRFRMLARSSQRLAALLCTAFAVVARTPPVAAAQAPLRVASPDGRNTVTVAIADGQLRYAVQRDGRPILRPSALGFVFRGAPALRGGLRLADVARASFDTTWTQPLGEVARVRDRHNELRVGVAETAAPGRTFTVVFRAFDDGIGFRYELPEQAALRDFEIMEELTEFAMADDARAWWIPATVPSPDRQEMLFSSSPVSRLDTVHTPLTMQTSAGVQVVVHEADLEDYAGMYLVGGDARTLHTTLARWADGAAVKGRTPMATPWRTIQLADRPGDLVPSLLGLKLNPPSRIADARWIRPMKYDGIWWGMHVNTMTWSSGPLHGATTENTRRYIDFAAANGLGGTLVEGWNVGWDGEWTAHGDKFSFTQAYPDYDLRGLAAYAKQKGVSLIVHNETSTFIENYERQLEDAFKLYQSLGVTAIKTGYVGDRTTPGGHDHQSQYMVRHHRRVIETAARYGIAVDMHEPIKDTGERRTWPNMLAREGARGQEFNAWGGEGGNPPEHETILFFTRMLAGPMDFTPGIFNLLLTRSGTNVPRQPEDARPRTTLAKQLALYVVLYSPVQMAADLPENYAGQPAFQFIRDVAVDWDTTRVLDGRIGDYVVVARKQKGADQWFVGAITDEEARGVDVPLDFLPAGRAYVAEVYADGPKAHWRDNPLPVTITSRPVTSATRLHLALAAGGGQAIRIRPAR